MSVSASIPIPVSLTAMLAQLLPGAVVSVTLIRPPESVNLTAL